MNIKEKTHLVVKFKTIKKYLTDDQQEQLRRLICLIDQGLMADGKDSHEYYVCNKDEPYADKVLQVILEGEEEKIRRTTDVNTANKKEMV